MANTKYHIVLDEWSCVTHVIMTAKYPSDMTEKQIVRSLNKGGDGVLRIFPADQEAEAREWAKTYRQKKMRDVAGKVIQKSWREIERGE